MSIIMKDQACKAWLAPEKPLWNEKQEQCAAWYSPVIAIFIISAISLLGLMQ